MPEALTDRNAALPQVAIDRVASLCQFAGTLLAEMQQYGIAPAPSAYELWFSFRSGSNPQLSQRMGQLLEANEALTPATVDRLYDEYIRGGSEADLDALGGDSSEIENAAQTLVQQVIDGRAAVQDYGNTLDHWARHIGDDPTIAGLISVISTLATETARAAERNRILEQQLAASGERIRKLRQSVIDQKHAASTDALTGVCNRRAFQSKLNRALMQLRSEQDGVFSLLLFDIDHFKQFNDTYGHKVGDLVLRLVARLLASNVKGRDLVARYGGEEFAIMLAGADLRAAEIVGRQISRALAEKTLVNAGSRQRFGRITVSVGVAQAKPGETGAVLVDRADQALYEAKRTGRNKLCAEHQPLGEVA